MAEDLISSSRFRPPGSCGDLRERVTRIGRLHRHGALAVLASEVNGLKIAARNWRFDLVATLAQSLETEIARAGRAAMVTAYIDRMDDAIDCDTITPAAAEAMMATVRARFLS